MAATNVRSARVAIGDAIAAVDDRNLERARLNIARARRGLDNWRGIPAGAFPLYGAEYPMANAAEALAAACEWLADDPPYWHTAYMLLTTARADLRDAPQPE